MDRNYYYRILGLRSDATPAQIKEAYENRIKRLNSADYHDEPEYARRKKAQANEAYRVLTGAAAPVLKSQKKINLPKINLSRVNTNKSKVVAIVATIIIATTGLGMVSAIFGLISDSFSNDLYVEEELLYDIQYAEDFCLQLDYYQMLDESTKEANSHRINWDQGVGEYGEDPLDMDINNLLFSLGIYDIAPFFNHITATDEFYFDYDDNALAVAIIDWMGAPSFEAIAGATSIYNGNPILEIGDYIKYLQEIVNNYE